MPASAFAGAYDDFFQAVKVDNALTVKSLLARGLDPNLIEPERGDTGLILALREESMKVFEVLLNARDIDLEAKVFNGDNALMIACYKQNKAAVEALLAKGAEVNRPGWTPLHYAAAIGNNQIVQILLDRYAYIDAESPNKTTPIMMAARGGHIMTVKLLLDEGADATLKNDLGMTAIDFAEKHEFKDIAEGLRYRLKRAGKL
ncbi:MAG: ankyrin repeat domain-containing protein [Noviherbaspirillum sp.]